MGTKLAQDVERVAEDQTLEPTKVWQAESWGTVRMCVVAPRPWNEIEEIALGIERTSQGALGMRKASPSSWGMD